MERVPLSRRLVEPNERIGVENYGEVIRFFHRLISVSAIEGK